VINVEKTKKDPVIVLSRSTPMLIKRLFELEIPEVFDGSVEIVSIAREAGSRTKISVRAKSPDIDAVGTCVGYKGTRILNILNEIGNERIDVVEYSADPVTYVKNALNPAEIQDVITEDGSHAAQVIVNDDQLSLAIGKDGQNVRLAAKLTGFKIDIKSREQYQSYLAAKKQEEERLALQESEESDEGTPENSGDESEGFEEALSVEAANAEQAEPEIDSAAQAENLDAEGVGASPERQAGA